MEKFKQLLSKPKSFLPIFALVVLVLSAVLYRNIGIAPGIPANIGVADSLTTPDGNISLSFAKNGRVEAVLVKERDFVKKGEVLARLSAPDALGTVNQAKGALALAQAQYASLNVTYANTKNQQDTMVDNAYKILLSSALEGTPSIQDSNVPVISGTYTCGKEGVYILKPYSSGDNDTGFSFNYSGLETGTAGVKYDNPVPLGVCGLQIKFIHVTNFNANTVWTINIPNTKSSVYLANKNAYDLAVSTREKILADISTQIGNSNDSSVAKAQVDAALGAYQAALGAYQNNIITSPVDGTVTFIDPNLKTGQSVIAGKSVISINAQ
jgi:multidrug efflux pump subunit AcrA (membrane-fusion protein)